MTAATGPRNTKQRSGDRFTGVVANGATIYAGTMVASNSDGQLVPANAAGAHVVLGVAEHDAVWDAYGTVELTYKRGVFCFAAGTGINPGFPCGRPVTAIDNQTVAYATESARVDGTLLAVDDDGAWVLLGFERAPLSVE